jgi:hypothetical protein
VCDPSKDPDPGQPNQCGSGSTTLKKVNRPVKGYGIKDSVPAPFKRRFGYGDYDPVYSNIKNPELISTVPVQCVYKFDAFWLTRCLSNMKIEINLF